MRKHALARFLNRPINQIYRSEYGYNSSTDLGTDYLVLTEEEANEEAKKHVLGFIHTFDPAFLNKHLVSEIPEDELRELISNCCENCLRLIIAFIADYKLFLEDAIRVYGRAYFICFDDKTEYIADYEGITYYIYRLI